MKTLRRSLPALLAALVLAGLVGCQKGDAGSAGAAGTTTAGPVSGLAGTVAVSTPAGGGGAYFDTGEQVVLTVTVTDSSGQAIAINSTNLNGPRLHIYGPLDQSKTVASQNLMRKTSATDYVKLDQVQDGLTVSGNVATFVTNAVAAEDAGTYRAMVWLRSKTVDLDQVVAIKEFQIKTATVETETVSAADKCSKCHQGADSKQFYFHHVDPTSPTSVGNPALDNAAIKSCKACHNQAGYSNTTDNWVAARTKTPDPLVRRVHGIHMGWDLRSSRNVNRMAVSNVVVTSSWAGLNADDAAAFVGGGLIRGRTSLAEARIFHSDGSAAGATWFAIGYVRGTFAIGETLDVLKIDDLTKTSWLAISGTNKIGTAVVATGQKTYNSDGSANDVAFQPGYFSEYNTVEVPCDVRNCTMCHVDNKWKEKPSKYACGACHDHIWWGAAAATPEGFENHPGLVIADIANGVAGAEHNTALCVGCHTSADPGFAGSIAGSHEVPTYVKVDQHTPATQTHTAALTMTAPANASYYVAGETPKVYVTITDVATGLPVTPSTITEGAWVNGLGVYVSGPRAARSTPVLTTQAATPLISTTCGNNEKWDLSGSPQFILTVNGKTYTLTALPASFVTPAQATATEVVAWLNGNATLPAGGGSAFNTVLKAFKDSSGKKVVLRNKCGVGPASISISATSSAGFTGAAATNMKWTTGVVSLPSTYGNDLRVRVDAAWDNDPKVTWNDVDKRIEYQLADVAGLTSGTYSIYVNGSITRPDAYAQMNFQVGTATADKYIAKNCTDCHGAKLWHLDAGGRHIVQLNTDYCKNCHDYKQEIAGADVANAGTSPPGPWWAYGADPVVRKVHGIHRGHYLQYPDRIYVNDNIWNRIIFPQDIRNCAKCHSSDTTGSWNTEPSRLACGACHDSDADELHMGLMTQDPTPVYDPVARTGGAWSGDEVESCKTCHGESKVYSAKKVHNISDPYVPPYQR